MNNKLELEKKRAIEVIDNICAILAKNERRHVMDGCLTEAYTVDQIRFILKQRWMEVARGCKYVYEKP